MMYQQHLHYTCLTKEQAIAESHIPDPKIRYFILGPNPFK